MKATGEKVITWVLGLTYAPCMDTYTSRAAMAHRIEHRRRKIKYKREECIIMYSRAYGVESTVDKRG